jgi:hypothetical protein|tara:strand:- start:233 stop:625 length:393 start_codon:yes stop_codon:yes gene_type:complete
MNSTVMMCNRTLVFRILSLFGSLILLAGCSAQPNPIIDTKGVDMTVYEQDLAECKTYSEQVPVAEGVAKSALGGAAVGGAIGGISKSGSIGVGAAVGAILGGAGSGVEEARKKENIVKRCLSNRGYSVLN